MIISSELQDDDHELLARLRLVTVDNPYRQLGRPHVQQLFVEMMARKAEGYGPPDYPEHTLPMDATEFVARHHLFCLDEPQALRVIGGYKTISLARCDLYGLTPPYVGLARTNGGARQAAALVDLCERGRAAGRDLLFSAGLTIDRTLRRQHRALSAVLKECMAALMIDDSERGGRSPMIIGGTPRFRTDVLCQQIGYRPLRDGAGPLPPLFLAHAGMEELCLMIMEEPDAWALALREKHAGLLAGRLELSPERVPEPRSIEQGAQRLDPRGRAERPRP